MEKHVLSKSTFIRGQQCLKSLYLNKKRPFLRDRLSQEQIAKFQRGTKVGIIAQRLFPGGIDVRPRSPRLYQKAVLDTQALIAKNTPVIYEATFQFNGVLIMLDILVRKDNKWYAFEVKSSLSVSETYIMDASLQYYVISNSGLWLEDFSIIYMNKDFKKKGEIDFNKLFISGSVLEEIKKKQGIIVDNIQQQKEIFELEHSPKIEIGTHCFHPYNCDFTGHCWKGLPKNNVFDLIDMKIEDQFELYEKGIQEIKDIKDLSNLNPLQQKQVECISKQEESFDSDLLKKFLSKIKKENLIILDLLSFYPAIPVYNESSPYQPIPFSFIIKRLKYNGLEGQGIVIHISEPLNDPRKEIYNELLKHITQDDLIIAFDADIIKYTLNELLKFANPKDENSDSSVNQIIDLKAVFEGGMYFHPELRKGIDIAQIANKVLNKRAGKIRSNIMAAHNYQQYVAEPGDREKRIIMETYLKFKANTIFNFLVHLKKLV